MLKPSEPGFIINITPMNPISMAIARRVPKDSCNKRLAIRVTVRGTVCNTAVAFAMGILNKAVKNSSVPHRSQIILRATREWSLLTNDFLNPPLTKQNTPIIKDANKPLMNIV